ncbi:MAG: hypothetical protein WAO02_06385 [Verrucomicrobiia bacterium]
MVEIAICLAIIGIALVSIIGVLPIGMNTQRDNREETIINQDATIFMEAIRSGAHGLDDLTNYVYAISNYWTFYDNTGASNSGGVDGFSTSPPSFLTNGMNIVGVLSRPEFIDGSGDPIPNVSMGGFSNHVVAYVRSISGPAIEKPLQDNDIVRQDSFGYRLLCVNAPVANYTPPFWVAQTYNAGDNVSRLLGGQYSYWQAIFAGQPSLPPQSVDVPGNSVRWMRVFYPEELAANLHELRLTFLWPQQPNGSVGPGHQTFRTLVAGQLTRDSYLTNLYFYASQSFLNVTN